MLAPNPNRERNSGASRFSFSSLGGLATLIFSIDVLGARLFLVYLYGWTRVQQEHLRILQMPKGQPWPVSNGDLIRDGHFIHFLFALACWYALFFATYPLLRRLLPKANE